MYVGVGVRVCVRERVRMCVLVSTRNDLGGFFFENARAEHVLPQT